MQMIALMPKEVYKLCADGRNAGVDGVDLECREHTASLLNILFPCGVVRGHAGEL